MEWVAVWNPTILHFQHSANLNGGYVGFNRDPAKFDVPCTLNVYWQAINRAHRPKKILEILGIDIGGSGMKAAPVDITTGEFLSERKRISTPRPATPKKMAGVVARLARHFEWNGPIGCAFPARIKNGVALTATNLDNSCIGQNIEKHFSEQTGLPVFVLNDADAAGVAEMSFGAGKDRHDLVLVLTIGTGIGSALFMQRTLIPNTEFGHINVKGRNGERYSSDATRRRKELSWSDWARRFQHYLNRIEFLVGPDLIILGGGISNPRKRGNYFKKLTTRADLKTAELGNRAGIVGAAMYAAKCLREDPKPAIPEPPSQ